MFRDPLDIIGQNARTAYSIRCAVALGESANFGGENTTGCHQDFALKGLRFYLEDELIAAAGNRSREIYLGPCRKLSRNVPSGNPASGENDRGRSASDSRKAAWMREARSSLARG